MTATEVKICGLVRERDARLAVELGARYLGLNFWPQSPRFITLEQARSIIRVVAGRALVVGVWVDPLPVVVAEVAEELGLDLLQFHGSVDSDTIAAFPGRVIRALRPGPETEPFDPRDYPGVWGFLFDCAPRGVFGGSGKAWSYERIAGLGKDKPLLLAGGLNPDNVADAIRRSGAPIVDVCSGVEAAPGVKDANLMRRFFHEVNDAQAIR